jgi:hypothetical protein
MTAVGFIGLGDPGAPMARARLRHVSQFGHPGHPHPDVLSEALDGGS